MGGSPVWVPRIGDEPARCPLSVELDELHRQFHRGLATFNRQTKWIRADSRPLTRGADMGNLGKTHIRAGVRMHLGRMIVYRKGADQGCAPI